MVKRPSELRSVEKWDPDSATAGAESGEFLEKRDDDLSATDWNESESMLATESVPEETEQIKAQIEETRNQMGETIDAIQERLSFANISEQVSETVNNAIESAKDTAYDATIGKAVNFMKNVGDGVSHSDAFRTVKSNPLPFALIGVGAGLLAYQTFSKSNSGRKGNGRRLGDYNRGNGESSFASASRAAGDTAGRAYDGISDTAGNALESVKGAATTAYGTVSDKLGNVYSSAGDVTQRAYERVGEVGTIAHEKYDQYIEENPLAVGAVALAVGAAVGFAIPSTRYEGKLMGDARENLMNRAQEAAGTLVDKAKQVANEAGQTIKEEARTLTQ